MNRKLIKSKLPSRKQVIGCAKTPLLAEVLALQTTFIINPIPLTVTKQTSHQTQSTLLNLLLT